jgi:hypothetical protein
VNQKPYVRCIFAAALCLSLVSAIGAQTPAAPSFETLRRQFISPPDAAKPMVRWWWFGAAVVKPEILRELQQMKADGIGGAELAFEYPMTLDDPAKNLKNLPFLSPEMLDDVAYAQAEGRKLGLRIDLTLGSGWPYGGPNTPLSEASSRLRTAEVPVAAQATTIAVPTLAAGETLISADIANAITAAAPAAAAPAVLAPAGAGPAGAFPGRGRGFGPAAPRWDAASATPLAVTGATITVAPSDKARVALFFVAGHTKQEVKRPAVGGEGWVLDHFSHEAVATHLEKVGEPLLKAFGATPPYAIFSDSLEVYEADWTPNLPAEFEKRRGYDLVPHLPELVAGGTPAAQTVRHDWGKTLTELFDENYLKQINDWAIAHGTKFRSQTYGDPDVSFSSQRYVSLPEGEGPNWRGFSSMRWVTSANHIFGNNVTSAETFTSLHVPVFRATPLDMKVVADLHFIIGTNQIICHGWPYSPPDGEVSEPGWSLYTGGAFNDHNPWHPVMPEVARYIQRVSFLMRQGQPANQVVILLPTDDAWASLAPGSISVSGEMGRLVPAQIMSAVLSAGYNVDYIDADAVNRLGIHHPILIVPPTDRIPVETLKKIQAYAAGGGKVISVGRAPSIDPEGKTDADITQLSKQLFDPANSTSVPDAAHLTNALLKAATPDFQLASSDETLRSQIGFIRRKLPNADIYFVANTSNQPIDTSVLAFGTKYSHGAAWDPDTAGTAIASPTSQPLHLAAYESRVFVFSASAPTATRTAAIPSEIGGAPIADLSSDWKVTFPSIQKTATEATLTDWVADPSTIHYSGEAVYSRDFTLDAAPTGPIALEVEGGVPTAAAQGFGGGGGGGGGSQAHYDPPIREGALVTINGQAAGGLWHPPYRLDVSRLLKHGRNHIEIRVYNTAMNAWAALPPPNFAPLIAKYGDRFQMNDLKDVKPIPSGILGTIHLVGEASKQASKGH